MYISRDLFSSAYLHLKHHAHSTTPSILILVALDTDALCAARILTHLLKRDFIPHKIHPVAGYRDLININKSLIKGNGDLRFLICMGLGGLVDLEDFLDLKKNLEGEVECWVVDSRRPWNLHNVFGRSEQQDTARILGEGIAGAKASGGRFGVGDKVGGVKVFDDGDVEEEMENEGKAFKELIEMPEMDSDDDSDDNDDSDEDNEALEETEADKVKSNGTHGRKRKSSDASHAGNRDDTEDEDTRDRSRRRKTDHGSDSDNEPDSGSPVLYRHQLMSHPLNRASSSSPTASVDPPASQLPQSPRPSSPSLPPPHPSQRTLRKRLRRLRRKYETVITRYYTAGTWYGEPCSGIIYSLASDLGREDNDILWLAIVGVSSGEIYGRGMAPSAGDWACTAREQRIQNILKDEVRRLNPPELLPNSGGAYTSSGGVMQTTAGSPNDTSIRISPEFRFMLVRHWSLYDSMLHSAYLGAKLKIWSENGKKKLHKLLAKMGFSLAQCKQRYTHMDMDLKRSLREKLEGVAGMYGIDEVVKDGFVRSWGWKACLSAADVGVVVGSILEIGKKGISPTRPTDDEPRNTEEERKREKVAEKREEEEWLSRFYDAYDALEDINTLLEAIPSAMALNRAIVSTGTSLIEKRQIRLLRSFRMAVVKDGPDVHLFTHPSALTKLAMWIGEAVYEQEKEENRKRHLPICLAALNEPRGVYVVVGMGSGTKIRKKSDAKKKEEKAKSEANKSKDKKKENKDKDEDDKEEETEEEEEVEEEEESDDEEEITIERGYAKNRFSIAFQEVANSSNARIRIDSFETCVVEVKRDDLAGFFEKLSMKMAMGN